MKTLFILTTLCLYFTVEGQRLSTQGSPNFRHYGYGWKFPGRLRVNLSPSITAAAVRLRSTVGNLERSPLTFRSHSEDGLPPYVLGFPGDISMVRLSMSNDIDGPEPPPHEEVAKMARFIVSQSSKVEAFYS